MLLLLILEFNLIVLTCCLPNKSISIICYVHTIKIHGISSYTMYDDTSDSTDIILGICCL